MMRRTPARRALPLIKLIILATRQVTKPFAKMVVTSATEVQIIDRLCISVGRLLLGGTGALRQEAEKQREKAEEAAKAKLREAELIARIRVEVSETLREDIATLKEQIASLQSQREVKDSTPNAGGTTIVSTTQSGVRADTELFPEIGSMSNPAFPKHRQLFGTSATNAPFPPEPRIEVEPFSIPITTIITPHVDEKDNRSTVLSNGRLSAANQSPLDSAFRISTVPAMTTDATTTSSSSDATKTTSRMRERGGHRTKMFGGASSQFHASFRTAVQDRFYAPVSDDTLRKAGAEILVEIVVFSILSIILTYEYVVSKKAETAREQAQLARLRALEEKVNELADKHDSISSLELGDIALPAGRISSLYQWWKGPSPATKSEKGEPEPDMHQRLLSKGITP